MSRFKISINETLSDDDYQATIEVLATEDVFEGIREIMMEAFEIEMFSADITLIGTSRQIKILTTNKKKIERLRQAATQYYFGAVIGKHES